MTGAAKGDGWDADAYVISVEFPLSEVTDRQLRNLVNWIADAVVRWEDSMPDRDWQPLMHGRSLIHPASP